MITQHAGCFFSGSSGASAAGTSTGGSSLHVFTASFVSNSTSAASAAGAFAFAATRFCAGTGGSASSSPRSLEDVDAFFGDSGAGGNALSDEDATEICRSGVRADFAGFAGFAFAGSASSTEGTFPVGAEDVADDSSDARGESDGDAVAGVVAESPAGEAARAVDFADGLAESPELSFGEAANDFLSVDFLDGPLNADKNDLDLAAFFSDSAVAFVSAAVSAATIAAASAATIAAASASACSKRNAFTSSLRRAARARAAAAAHAITTFRVVPRAVLQNRIAAARTATAFASPRAARPGTW